MKRRLDRTTDIHSGLLGRDWNEIGQDGGTEISAWRDRLASDQDPDFRPGQHLLPSTGRLEVRRNTISPPRTWSDRLFKDGLMAPIFLGSIVLLPLFAWLAGFR